VAQHQLTWHSFIPFHYPHRHHQGSVYDVQGRSLCMSPFKKKKKKKKVSFYDIQRATQFMSAARFAKEASMPCHATSSHSTLNNTTTKHQRKPLSSLSSPLSPLPLSPLFLPPFLHCGGSFYDVRPTRPLFHDRRFLQGGQFMTCALSPEPHSLHDGPTHSPFSLLSLSPLSLLSSLSPLLSPLFPYSSPLSSTVGGHFMTCALPSHFFMTPDFLQGVNL